MDNIRGDKMHDTTNLIPKNSRCVYTTSDCKVTCWRVTTIGLDTRDFMLNIETSTSIGDQ